MDVSPAITQPPRPSCAETLAPATLFSSPWWLDAAAPGAWGEVTVEESGRVAARLAYSTRRVPLIGTVLGQPPLTPYLGPECSPSRKPAGDFDRQNRLYESLIEALPPHARFQQNFHPSVANWLPFFWKSFQQHTRYTYRFDDISDPEQVIRGFSSRAKQTVRRAEKAVAIDDNGSAADVHRLTCLTLSNQNKRPGYSLEYLERVSEAAISRGQGKLFVARDAQDVVHAGMLLVWDDRCAYYLVGGSDPEHRQSGAASLLIRNAIQFASNVTTAFDFEGSMQPGIEFFFRSFKPQQTPYFRVARSTAMASAATYAVQQARRWRGAA